MVLLEPSSLNFKNLGTTNMMHLYRVQSQVCSQVYIHMFPTLWLWLWGGNEHDGLGKTIVFRWSRVMDLGANKVANYTWFSSFPSSPSYFIFRPPNYPVLPLGFPTFPRKSEIWGSPICELRGPILSILNLELELKQKVLLGWGSILEFKPIGFGIQPFTTLSQTWMFCKDTWL